jgi:hypothetical protein
MAHNDQFTATGPAFTGSGFPRAAFSTNRAGADFVHGVNVEASECGVFGKCVQGAGTGRNPTVAGVGVFGVGDSFGVLGKGDLGGVRRDGGRAPARRGVRVAGTGVIGHGGPVRDASTELPGPGVIGVGSGARDPDPKTSAGVGIFGIGTTESARPGSTVGGTGVVGKGNRSGRGKTGAGVVGVSSAIELPSAETTAGVGVYGESSSGPGVLGVWGGPIAVEKRGGAGVVGKSGSGPGGEFSSSATGQVHLVPSNATKFPIVGRRGDLWMHNHRGNAPRRRQPSASLYICVQDQPVVIWQQVLMDPTRFAGGTAIP